MIELRHQDCMEYMAGLPDKAFDLAIVDPPYGLGGRVVNSGGRFKTYKRDSANWDMAVPPPEYFDELRRVSVEQIIWGGNYFALPPTRCFLIWDKKQPEGMSMAMVEMAWTSFDDVARSFYQFPSHVTQGKRIHPTQKPVELYQWLLKNYAKPGQRILDTHGGSMSIAIACDIEGFDLTLCEIDKDYFEAGKKRLADHQAQPRLFTAEHKPDEQLKIDEAA